MKTPALALAAILALAATDSFAQGQQGARYRRLSPEIFDVTPPSERVRGAPGDMVVVPRACRTLPTAQVRRRIVDITVQEWGFFGFPITDATHVEHRILPQGIVPDAVNPQTGTPRVERRYPRLGTYEDSERVAASIAGYWAVTPEGPGILAAQNRAWKGPGGDDVTWQEPWSAAFISWIMCEAGLGTPQQFVRAVAHHSYVDQAIRARDGAAPQAAFVAYDPGEAAISPGDLLCNAARPNYRSIADRRRVLGVGARSHCDVVVKVDEAGKRVFVIGGNSHRSVSMILLPATREPGKHLRPGNGTELVGMRTTFAHLKLRAEPIEANALDNSPTVRSLGCAVSFPQRAGAPAPAQPPQGC